MGPREWHASSVLGVAFQLSSELAAGVFWEFAVKIAAPMAQPPELSNFEPGYPASRYTTTGLVQVGEGNGTVRHMLRESVFFLFDRLVDSAFPT